MKRRKSESSIADWHTFIEDSVGGYEIYKFVCEAVVHSLTTRVETAANLRLANKAFQKHIDAELELAMHPINLQVGSLYQAIKRCYVLELTGAQPTAPAQAQHRRAQEDCLKDTREQQGLLTVKLGADTTSRLSKCFRMHLDAEPGLNTHSDVAFFSATGKSFLALAAKNACVFSHGKPCRCRNVRGDFIFVPNGRGLVMRCSQACMDERCVYFDSAAGQSSVVSVAANDTRNANFLKNLLVQNGISHPFSLDCFKRRINRDDPTRYSTEITSVRAAMTNSPSGHRGIKMMLLDPDSAPGITTLQSLLYITKEQIDMANSFISHADQVVETVRLNTRDQMRQFATFQSVKVINEYLKEYAVLPIKDLSELESLLPGAGLLIERFIIHKIETKTIDTIYSTHVLGIEWAMKLFKLIACVLGPLKRLDSSFVLSNASKFAYAYTSGVCAGMDSSFSERDFRVQLRQELVFHSTSEFDRDQFHKRVVLAMHIFDLMDHESVKVRTEFTHKSAADYKKIDVKINNASQLFEVEFTALGRRFFVPLTFNIYGASEYLNRKMEIAEELLNKFDYDSTNLWPVPRLHMLNTLKKRDLISPEAELEALADWFQNTASQLCSTPETRAIGLDLLTNGLSFLILDAVDDYGELSVDDLFDAPFTR